ncbi:MAG: hypothetical protein ACRCT1_16950 [Microcoleaceae cyanobacterium]
MKEEGRGMKEEGRGKRDEGRGMKDNIYGLILFDRALPFSLTDYLDFFIFDGIFSVF